MPDRAPTQLRGIARQVESGMYAEKVLLILVVHGEAMAQAHDFGSDDASKAFDLFEMGERVG